MLQTQISVWLLQGWQAPTGDAGEAIGLVYIACYMNDKVHVEEFRFKGDRQKIRERSVVQALDVLRRSILEFA